MSKGRQANQTDLADIHGCSLPTIRAWVRRGCPVVQRGGKGREWLFNTADVAQWREEEAAAAAVGDTSKMDIDEARRRKEAALAGMAELDLSKRRGELIEIESIAEIVGEEYSRVRAKLMGMPVKLAPVLEQATTVQEYREIVEDAVVECLSELAADEFSGEESAGGAEQEQDDEAPAAA